MEHRVTIIGGGKPLPGKTIISKDQLHAIAPFNGQLSVYALATRLSIRTLKFNESNGIDFDGLVCIKEDPSNAHVVWAFKASGEVLVINWKDKQTNPLVRTIQLELSHKDNSLLQVVKFDDKSLVVVTGKNSPNPHTKTAVSYNLETLESSTLLSVKNVLLIAVSNNSQHLAFLGINQSQKATTVLDLSNSETKTIPFPYNNAFFSSLAVSNEGSVAIGTTNGIIHLLQDSTQRVLKWHIDQVKALSFTNDSNYLLSGGLEKVLVFWQLDTDKQQYLPRLNGEIVDISTLNSEHHNLTLKVDNQDNHEILILSSVDLHSRLLVTGPRQLLNSEPSNLSKIHKLFNKNKGKDPLKIKYDLTSVFKIHPTSKQLYLLNGLFLQIFDIYKNEQVSVLKVSSSLTTGKVRSELKLQDSIVKDFIFTEDGNWLITMEEFHHGEVDDLLSKKDYTYTLKFWKSIQVQSKTSTSVEWELVTKIINPHGANVPILSLIPAPKAYYKGLGVLTADNHGGVRLWRPNSNTVNKTVSWSLRKLKPSTGIISNSISLTWSNDSSLIFVGIDYNLSVIDVDSFEEIDNEFTEKLTNITGSSIKSIDIVDNHLVILSKSIFKTVDLLSLKESDLNIKLNAPKNGASQQIAINHDSNLIALIQNYYDITNSSTVAKILIFSPSTKKPIYETTYPTYISSIKWNNEQDFVFMDMNSRIAMITTSKIPTDTTGNSITDSGLDHTQEIAQLLTAAQASNVTLGDDAMDVDNADEINGFDKRLDVNSFFNLFENIEGDIKLDTMFERVMQVIN